MSWNGATEVARWELLGGAERERARPDRLRRTTAGFETAVSTAPLVALRAYDAAGRAALRAAGKAVPSTTATPADSSTAVLAASWPQAASMSRPRVSRTVARRPCSSSAALKASIALREDPS